METTPSMNNSFLVQQQIKEQLFNSRARNNQGWATIFRRTVPFSLSSTTVHNLFQDTASHCQANGRQPRNNQELDIIFIFLIREGLHRSPCSANLQFDMQGNKK